MNPMTCGASPDGPDSDDPVRPHVLARAQRIQAVHVRDSDRDTCGLCLCSWPCPPRAWADVTLGAPRPGRLRTP